MSETHVRYFTMELDPAFTWAMVGVVVTMVHYIVINFMGGKHRRDHFSAEFMASKFNEQHRAAFQKDAPKGGYPDCGNGLYSLELSYKQWFDFNLAQRNAKHYLEMVSLFVFCLFVLAFVWPIASIVFAAINFIARTGFVYFYSKQPVLRKRFGPPMIFNVAAALWTTFAACIYWQVQVYQAPIAPIQATATI